MNYYIKDFDDYDISLYSAYVSRLAAVATPGDPPPLPWRSWFNQKYHAAPGFYRPASTREAQARTCRASLRHGRNLHADRHADFLNGDAVA